MASVMPFPVSAVSLQKGGLLHPAGACQKKFLPIFLQGAKLKVSINFTGIRAFMPSLICGGAIFFGALYLFSFGTLCLDTNKLQQAGEGGNRSFADCSFSDILSYPIEIVSCQQQQRSVCDAGRSDVICLKLEKKKSGL